MQPSTLDIDCLSTFPFFDGDFCLLKLKSELLTIIYYLSKCADTDEDFSVLKWNAPELPYWTEAAQKASFNEQQDNTLQDCLESSLMLQYNKH